MGLEGGHAFDTKVWDFTLVLFRGWRLVAWCFLFALLLGLFLWMAAESDIIRESGPPPRPDKNGKIPRKAFSLARTQMAWWTFLVIAGFILIWMVTWDSGAIPPSVLALIGISTATGLAGAVVDKSSVSSLASEQSQLSSEKAGLQAETTALRTQLAAPPSGTTAANIQAGIDTRTARIKAIDDRLTEIAAQAATSATEGFFIDILSDANGLSFHRFQLFAWTVVLGIIFIASFVRQLEMLDFSATLLGLMGISSGTYIGFKFPEQKNPS
jgi:FtsH-binding integral membrane protein